MTMTEILLPPDPDEDLTEEVIAQLERTEALISRLWATLLHAGIRDELLERDVDERLRAIADVLRRARWHG